MPQDYGRYTGQRVAVGAGAWNPIVIPAGAENVLMSLEDELASYRVWWTNADPLTAGHYVVPANLFHFEGTCQNAVTVYVNPSAATTVAVSYTLEF